MQMERMAYTPFSLCIVNNCKFIDFVKLQWNLMRTMIDRFIISCYIKADGIVVSIAVFDRWIILCKSCKRIVRLQSVFHYDIHTRYNHFNCWPIYTWHICFRIYDSIDGGYLSQFSDFCKKKQQTSTNNHQRVNDARLLFLFTLTHINWCAFVDGNTFNV